MRDEIRIRISPNGILTFTAYCLRTDSWKDYCEFSSEAEAAIDEGNVRKTNRLTRAALVCFFSHLEGVVNYIESRIHVPTIHCGNRLCDRIRNVSHEAKKRGRVPEVEFRLGKHLRDLIAHPGIDIDFSDRENSTVLTQNDVFDRLSVWTLRSLEAKIVPWIDAVCYALRLERFTDTEARCHKVAALLVKMGDFEIKEV